MVSEMTGQLNRVAERVALPGSHTTWHTGPYRGGSTELSLGGRIESGETERVETAVAQRLLDRRVA